MMKPSLALLAVALCGSVFGEEPKKIVLQVTKFQHKEDIAEQ